MLSSEKQRSVAFEEIPYALMPSNEVYGIKDHPELQQSRRDAEDKFINGDERWPSVEYPELNGIELRKAETLLYKYLGIITLLDDDSEYEMAARKLAEVYRHLEVLRSIGSFGVSQELSRNRAGDMSIELHGAPDETVFISLLYDLQDKARSLVNGDDSRVSTIARELLALTTEVDETERIQLELTDQALELIDADLRDLLPEFYDTLVDIDETIYSVDEAIEIIQKSLDALQMHGWRAVKAGGNQASTSAANKTISIGQDRKPFTATDLNKTNIHETIGHAFRAFNANGKSSPNGLAFEEGFATALEQILTGKKRMPGVQYYLALGLQLGMDKGGDKRDYRDVSEIMWRRDVIEAAIKGETIIDDNTHEISRSAYRQTMRTTRGNALDARDISYFEGFSKAAPFLNKIAGLEPEVRKKILKRVLGDRFDPTNPYDIPLSQKDVILDKELNDEK